MTAKRFIYVLSVVKLAIEVNGTRDCKRIETLSKRYGECLEMSQNRKSATYLKILW